MMTAPTPDAVSCPSIAAPVAVASETTTPTPAAVSCPSIAVPVAVNVTEPTPATVSCPSVAVPVDVAVMSAEKAVVILADGSSNTLTDGAAYVLYLRPLDGSSSPISVRIENCVSRGTNSISASVTTSNGGPNGPARGLIEFVNCRFEDTGTAGISVRDVPADACRVRFRMGLLGQP